MQVSILASTRSVQTLPCRGAAGAHYYTFHPQTNGTRTTFDMCL